MILKRNNLNYTPCSPTPVLTPIATSSSIPVTTIIGTTVTTTVSATLPTIISSDWGPGSEGGAFCDCVICRCDGYLQDLSPLVGCGAEREMAGRRASLAFSAASDKFASHFS